MKKILSTSIILLIVLAGCSSSHYSAKKMKHNGNNKMEEGIFMTVGLKKTCLNHYTKRSKNSITQNRRK